MLSSKHSTVLATKKQINAIPAERKMLVYSAGFSTVPIATAHLLM